MEKTPPFRAALSLIVPYSMVNRQSLWYKEMTPKLLKALLPVILVLLGES